MNVFARSFKSVPYKRVVITLTICFVAVAFFVLFSESLLDYTKVVAWNSSWNTLWVDPRLKSFQLNKSIEEELYKCQQANHDRKCPSYFGWIHEDLATWSETGITQDSINEAKLKADFRVVIVDGKLYYDRYRKCFQTRDDYSLWGLLTMLERFPGSIPDVEMLFVCGDLPQIVRKDYPKEKWPPPPLFSYCTTRNSEHFDIVFPDWSFWGWPEVNIRPWSEERSSLIEAASTIWCEKKSIAYWKGNIWVGTQVRKDLLRCNNSEFNLVVYNQDWESETKNNFSSSSLSDQCNYRYKVYVEGNGWSVSLKYIMACGSTVLQIEPVFWDFFARSWLPYVHYWPVSKSNMCNSIKYAVDWGNAYPSKVASIGNCGRSFIENQLTMDHVYAYMVHLINAYSKLQRFKPVASNLTPVTRDSTLTWHELTLPSNRTKKSIICELQARDQESISKILASQAEGYASLQT